MKKASTVLLIADIVLVTTASLMVFFDTRSKIIERTAVGLLLSVFSIQIIIVCMLLKGFSLSSAKIQSCFHQTKSSTGPVANLAYRGVRRL